MALRNRFRIRWTSVLPAVLPALLLTLLLALTLGCDGGDKPDGQVARVRSDQLVRQRRKQDFAQAMYFLNHLDQFEASRSHEQILQFLNRWIEGHQPDPEWLVDPMVSRLPSKYLGHHLQRDLSELEFRGGFLNRGLRGGDVDFLQEAVWMRDVSHWVAASENLDPDLAEWFASIERSWDASEAHALKTAAVLFDWTVRNIQLEETPPKPAVPGAEYKPWEVLQLGRGDVLQRARVFILLARQQGIPVVMLSLGGEDADRPRPWLPAALVGERLFLFDTALGLPIPGPDGRGIASLDAVIDDAGLLRRLDLPGRPYPVAQADLKTAIALIDASPGFVSQRMRMIEIRLAGDQKLVLSIVPSALAKRVRRCRGIADVRLWTLPYEAMLAQARRRKDIAGTVAWITERAMFDRFTPLYRARLLHFRGTFDNEGTELGARAFYLQCRPSAAKLRQLPNSPEVQKQFGLAGLSRDALQRAVVLYTRAKQDASFWLGLVAFENRQYEVAANDFQKRSLDAYPDGPWTRAARYNLARSLERLGWQDNDPVQFQAAIEAYEQSTGSPQRHGDLLRARRLADSLRRVARSEERRPRSTMIYTHVLNRGGRGVRSPADQRGPGPSTPGDRRNPPNATAED